MTLLSEKLKVNELKAGVILSYLSLLLHSIIGLFFAPYLLHKLGQAEYGVYSLAAVIIAYLTILDLGFFNTIARYTAKFREEQKIDQQYELFGMFLRLYLMLGSVAFLGGMLVALNVEFFFHKTMNADELWQTKVMLIILSCNLGITFPLSIFGAIIMAYQRFLALKGVQVLRQIIQTGCMILILEFGFKAIGLVVITTLFNCLVLGYQYWYCKKYLNVQISYKNFNWILFREIMAYSFFVFLGTIMDKIFWNTGQFVLGMFVSTTAVAIFTLALQLEQIYMSCSGALSGVFFPKVTAMVAAGRSPQELSLLFIKIGRLQFVFLAFMLTGFIIFGRQFIRLWVGEAYWESYWVALIIFSALLVPLIQNVGISILAARNQLKFRAYTYSFIAILSLGLQVLGALHWGAIGCAVAIAIALILGQGIIMNIYYYKKQQIDILHFWREIIRMAIVPICVGVLGYWLSNFWSAKNFTILVTQIILFSCCYIPACWLGTLNHTERELFSKPLKILQKRIIKL